MTKSTKLVKKKIALLTGGYGAERSISLKSALFVEDSLDLMRFDVYVIYIDQDRWYHRDSNISVDRNDFSLTLDSNKISFDYVFIMIHGDPAENGLIQGYFQSLGLPISTCDTFVSALTFNKYVCNYVLTDYGVLSARSKMIRRDENWECRRIPELGFPMFVKPNNNGSSYGITKVKREDQLAAAIAKGFEYDDELIIEEFLDGREFTCGAIELKDQIHTFPVTEIKSHNEYFDFQAKYENASEEITPADLSDELTKACQAITRRIYKVLNCRGMVRVDFILKDKVFFLIEVNTIPGMTLQSLYPQQVRAYGWEIKDLLTQMIEEGSA
jgi:D-alanine-D-alanine ligase